MQIINRALFFVVYLLPMHEDEKNQAGGEAARHGSSMKTTDLVFVDIETTGMDSRVQEIIEIGLLRVSQSWQDGVPTFVEQFAWNAKISPKHIETADPAALRINGYSADGWSGATELSEALALFSDKTAGAIMVAHNVAFDFEFLNANLARYAIPNRMHYHRLDTVSMAYQALRDAPETSRYSLVELCKHFGIEFLHPHSAMPDVYADFELFKKLVTI